MAEKYWHVGDKAFKESDFDHCDYLRRFLRPDDLKEQVRLGAIALSKIKPDAIAFTGNSGALIGAALAYETGIPMILVRKPSEDCHSSREVEGYRKAKTYVIVDDCVASGKTARRVQKEIKTWSPDAKCLGALTFLFISEAHAFEGTLDTDWMRNEKTT